MRVPVSGKLFRALGKGNKGRRKIKPVHPSWNWRKINAGTAVDYGLKAWNAVKHIATLINVENKCFDVDGSGGTTITATPTVANLSNIAQGSDYFNRQGDSILVQTLEFRCVVTGNAATGAHRLRILIVSDRLQQGTDPTLGEVLQNGTDPTVQPYLEPKDNRFDVLYDEVITLTHTVGVATSGTSTTYVPGQKICKGMDRKWNKHIQYSSTAGADASNWIGGLYLMAVSLDGANGPSIRYTFRIRYTDN